MVRNFAEQQVARGRFRCPHFYPLIALVILGYIAIAEVAKLDFYRKAKA